MRCILIGPLCILIGLLSACSSLSKADLELIKADLALFQGDWVLVEYRINGIDAPKEVLKEVRILFENQTFKMKPMPVSTYFANMETTWKTDKDFESAFELGKSGKSKTIALITEDGNEKYSMKGIYRLEHDSLTVCFSTSEELPTEFEGKPNTESRLLKMERIKK